MALLQALCNAKMQCHQEMRSRSTLSYPKLSHLEHSISELSAGTQVTACVCKDSVLCSRVTGLMLDLCSFAGLQKACRSNWQQMSSPSSWKDEAISVCLYLTSDRRRLYSLLSKVFGDPVLDQWRGIPQHPAYFNVTSTHQSRLVSLDPDSYCKVPNCCHVQSTGTLKPVAACFECVSGSDGKSS